MRRRVLWHLSKPQQCQLVILGTDFLTTFTLMMDSYSYPVINPKDRFSCIKVHMFTAYSKTCLKRPLSKRQKIGFQDQLSLNTDQKYWRMLQGEHSAILWTFIELQFVIKTFVLSIFEWLFYTGFTVFQFAVYQIKLAKVQTTEGKYMYHKISYKRIYSSH